MPARRVAKSPARGPGRLTSEASAELDERLVAAAEQVFVNRGYAGTTMDAIARAAATTRRTLYARYANKAKVLESVVSRLLDAAMQPHQQEAHARPRKRDPKALLLQIARELASLSAAPQVAGINRLVFAEAQQAPDLARLFLDLHARAADDVRANLETLREEGELPRLPDSRMAAVIFIEMTASMPRLRARLGAPFGREESKKFTSVAVEIFLRGCGRLQE
jgi:AcrR family transcriptional regulator